MAVLAIIWEPLRSEVAHWPSNYSGLFKRLAYYLTVFWIGYPLIWLLGEQGFGVAPSTVEVIVFTLIDLLTTETAESHL
jgi:bacteriorhodopsin